MSYILDALKRADAERERGAVPGLHARQVGNLPPHSNRFAQKRLWLITAAALGLVTLAATVWLWPAPLDKAARVAAPSSPAPVAAVSMPVTPAPTPAPTLPASAAVAVSTAASATPLPVVKAPAAPVAPVSVPLLSEMPADFRQLVPAMTINGVVYSDSPGQRLLLVNGQVVTQGALAAPDLTLEEIRAKSSIFSFRGTRFRLKH